MTKERRLAIEMWEEIVKMCQYGYSKSKFNIVSFKDKFCRKHKLNWANSCYFCQYCRSCSKCPISDCMSVYTKASHDKDVESAETILNALKGVKNEV